MSSQIKITADTTAVKKSIIDLGKELKDIKSSNVQIFSSDEKKFLKGEAKKAIAQMKNDLKASTAELAKMTAEQAKMVKGSEEELQLQEKILGTFQKKIELAKKLAEGQKMLKASSGGGGGKIFGGGQGTIDSAGGGTATGIMGLLSKVPGIAAAAAIGYTVMKGVQANDQYVKGSGARNQLKGLGVGEDNFGSAAGLARVGLTEQDMIQRRIDATKVLGRQGTSNELEMKKAGFERAYGLDAGTMTGIAGQMRGQMGGAGASDAQMKLQASVMAAGLEDAIGPYLESAVALLTEINDNGMTNTGEITAVMAQLTKASGNTPEQLKSMFGSINDSVKNATGEKSAFFQQAFAQAGIGGGTIGGTKFAMDSGGIFGLDRKNLEGKGYNPELLNNLEGQGMFSGVGKRSGAILNGLKRAGGMGQDQSLDSITNPDQMVGIGNFASNTLGVKDPMQAFQAARMLEQVQKGEMSKETFQEKLKTMQEGQDPVVDRLDKINKTLSGISQSLRLEQTNEMENLGKNTVQTGNSLVKSDIEGMRGVNTLSGTANAAGMNKAYDSTINSGLKAINDGKIGEAMYGLREKVDNNMAMQKMSDQSIIDFAKKRRDEGTGYIGMTDEQITQKLSKVLSAKEIGKEVGEAIRNNQQAPPLIKNTITLPDGKVTDQINK